MKVVYERAIPVITGVTITMTAREAELIHRFLGPTNMSLVEDLLPNENKTTQCDINDALYDLYSVLNNSK